MKDPDIRLATASEALSLEDEYGMQRSWRTDKDKLTFISCQSSSASSEIVSPLQQSQDEETNSMLGDVNLFILANEEDSGNVSLVGELELMIGNKSNMRRGLGRAALLTFIAYVLKHEQEILEEYFSAPRDMTPVDCLDYYRVKIGETNVKSIGLFESLGFKTTEGFPNFFGEYELRVSNLKAEDVDTMMKERGIEGYAEVAYELGNDEKVRPVFEAQDERSAHSETGNSTTAMAKNGLGEALPLEAEKREIKDGEGRSDSTTTTLGTVISSG
ncbi:hypothetical protein PMZ80_004433 [Knufia obscura]|nr:hypothetical protein PMZ80_004433 [Knufia obscura]